MEHASWGGNLQYTSHIAVQVLPHFSSSNLSWISPSDFIRSLLKALYWCCTETIILLILLLLRCGGLLQRGVVWVFLVRYKSELNPTFFCMIGSPLHEQQPGQDRCFQIIITKESERTFTYCVMCTGQGHNMHWAGRASASNSSEYWGIDSCLPEHYCYCQLWRRNIRLVPDFLSIGATWAAARPKW